MRQQKAIYSILLLLLLISCKKDFFDSVVEVEIPAHTPQLTLVAHFNDLFDHQFVDVRHSVSVLDSATIEVVRDARIQLLEANQVLTTFGLEEDTNPSHGFSLNEEGIKFSPDKTYTIKVNSPEYGQVIGTQTMPTKVAVQHATYEEMGAIDRWGDRGDKVSIQFNDPPNEQNYYVVFVDADLFITTKDSSFAVENFYTHVTPVDPLLEEVSNDLFLSDAGFDGTTYTLQVATFFSERLLRSQRNNRWGDNAEAKLEAVNVYLLSVSKDYYLFHKSFANYRDNKENFFAEPSNVYENVEGGIGIFTLGTGDMFKIEF